MKILKKFSSRLQMIPSVWTCYGKVMFWGFCLELFHSWRLCASHDRKGCLDKSIFKTKVPESDTISWLLIAWSIYSSFSLASSKCSKKNPFSYKEFVYVKLIRKAALWVAPQNPGFTSEILYTPADSVRSSQARLCWQVKFPCLKFRLLCSNYFWTTGSRSKPPPLISFDFSGFV